MTDKNKGQGSQGQGQSGQGGKKMGQQGREEVSAMSDADLQAAAAQYGVSVTNDDGTPRDRTELVNEVANKIRQAGRQEDKNAGETTTPTA